MGGPRNRAVHCKIDLDGLVGRRKMSSLMLEEEEEEEEEVVDDEEEVEDGMFFLRDRSMFCNSLRNRFTAPRLCDMF